MTHRQTIICLLVALGALAPVLHAQVRDRWMAETSRPTSHTTPAFQGETICFEPIILNYGTPVAWPADTTVRLYWQTNGMGQAWWSVSGSTGTVAGQITATWSPTNDVGAAVYTFFLGGTAAAGTMYRAYGTIKMSASPGFAPAAAPPPTYYPTLAAAVAPYVADILPAADPAGTAQAVSNALAAALQSEALARATGDATSLTNWQAIVYTMTNGATLGSTAVQPADTNGWVVGSHVGLATWAGATNITYRALTNYHPAKVWTDAYNYTDAAGNWWSYTAQPVIWYLWADDLADNITMGDLNYPITASWAGNDTYALSVMTSLPSYRHLITLTNKATTASWYAEVEQYAEDIVLAPQRVAIEPAYIWLYPNWYIDEDRSMAQSADVLHRDGTLPATGDLDMGGHSITNLSPDTIYFTNGTSLPSLIPSAGWRNASYWSIDMVERFVSVAQTVVTTNSDVIAHREVAGIGKVNWQITPDVLRGFPDGTWGYSVSGTAGSIDPYGLLTMESEGLVDVTVTNGSVSKTAAVDLYYSTEGEERSVIYSDVPGTARAAAVAGIDGRLTSLDDNYWLTNSPPSTFARNTNCWAAAADLSGVVVSTGTGAPAWHGTLLTTQHIIMAKHAYDGVGSTKRFCGRSGSNYVRTVTAILDPAPDIAAGNVRGDYVFARLDAALPTNDVCVYPVMPANYTTWWPTTPLRVPVIIYDQLGCCHVADLNSFASLGQPTATNRLAHWSMPYGGDSGRPVFAWLGDQLVFLFALSTATAGYSAPTAYRTSPYGLGMDDLLSADGAALTDADLSTYTEF